MVVAVGDEGNNGVEGERGGWTGRRGGRRGQSPLGLRWEMHAGGLALWMSTMM